MNIVCCLFGFGSHVARSCEGALSVFLACLIVQCSEKGKACLRLSSLRAIVDNILAVCQVLSFFFSWDSVGLDNRFLVVGCECWGLIGSATEKGTELCMEPELVKNACSV